MECRNAFGIAVALPRSLYDQRNVGCYFHCKTYPLQDLLSVAPSESLKSENQLRLFLAISRLISLSLSNNSAFRGSLVSISKSAINLVGRHSAPFRVAKAKAVCSLSPFRLSVTDPVIVLTQASNTSLIQAYPYHIELTRTLRSSQSSTDEPSLPKRGPPEAHKKLQKGWPISKVVLYTTSQLIVKNLMSTNSKPLGSQLSIAVSLAFDVIATDFPEVDIEVRGFNKSWATAPGSYTEDLGMLQPLAQRAYHEVENARTFTKRSLSFPQSASIGMRSGLGNIQCGPPPHMPSSDGIGTRQGPSVRSQIQDSPYHIKTCFKGNSWYDITDKEGNEILPSHLQGGPWFQTYQGVKAADNLPLFARLIVRFFPNEPYKACQCDLKSPETRQHLLMVCSLFVRRINHYDLDGITTTRGLILFLQDNPQAFSFKPPELPQHADESWPAYRKELELARDEENKRRKKKRLLPLTGPIFLHESIEFVRHWNVWEMDDGWGDIFRAIERGTKPVSQALLKRASTSSAGYFRVV
ncbi:hypothetical protein AGABI1DRAFT_94577 [Agaricus bisporus var. burnettii JB137-S8]|uniref:Uncharacterized protein n=1 Tax=Agaricus bisporus var. burnettii (strain JB137-S8 / ATCC MYA-4627 / FGSC 10392) TaxID=597362 RepID=K5WKG5_AGABU|nr:uncharacterized protein AGABI1DRAFT_94577 [Agaricus bisporus var. burnettii JB137-S8]EKM75786.1 hypothetical protein AGABI1DRAFT_94577 [Agaricus bisporus var. burnettii JB137-S8]